MAKKVILDTKSESILFTLIGISCHLKDYRLSFHLNQALELSLVKLDDFHGYSFYFCRDEDSYNSYYLLGNRGQDSILFPDLRQTDYLLLLEGPVKKPRKEYLLNTIRSIPNVLTSFEVRFETIKNYNSVLTDLELHLMSILKAMKPKYSHLKK
jgi:hypothetical protein